MENGTPYIYEKDGEKLSLMLDEKTGEYHEYYHFPGESTGNIDEKPANVEGANLRKVSAIDYDEWCELSLVTESNG